MRNIILILLLFFIIFGLTQYLSTRINVKCMIKAVDADGNIINECSKMVKKGREIKSRKDIKAVGKNLRLCKWLEISMFLFIYFIISLIGTVLYEYNVYGYGLFRILSVLYFIYNILQISSNHYKAVIISEYVFIFTSVQILIEQYESVKKIPFVNKLEIFNLADSQMKLKLKNDIKQQNNDSFSMIGEYIQNYFEQEENVKNFS